MNETQRNKRMEQAQLRVLFTVPFFAPGVAKLPIVWDSSIETACTDGRKIMWSPEFFDKCEDQELVTVLCEEVGHCLLGHLWRKPAAADMRTWNFCCDQTVRNMMKEFGEQVQQRRLANPFPFPGGDAFLPDPQYKNMSEEAIYASLPKDPQGSGGGKSIKVVAPGSASGQGGGKASGKNQSGQGGQPPQPAPFAEFVCPDPVDSDPQGTKDTKSDWEATLVQSVTIAKGRGNCPGMLDRIVNDVMNPKVPWRELIKTWLREKCDDDWNWMKPNRFFDESEFILPSLDGERIGAIVFATDTSGSIDNDMLAQFQAEKQACLDDMKPAKLIDMCCDTRITQEKEYRIGDTIDTKAPGGGGTCFEPVFDRLDELPEKPKMLVYLTDLHGTFPAKHPDFPVLWVVYGGKNDAPFGEVVEVN